MSDAPLLPPESPPPATAPKTPGAPLGIGPPWLRGLLAVPYAIVLQGVALLLLGALALLLPITPDPSRPGSEMLVVAALCLLVVPVLWVTWMAFGQASLADMGHAGPARRALREILVGALAGVALLSAIVGIGAALGVLTIGPADWRAGLRAQALWVPTLLLLAYFEELLIRGWVMQDLGRRWPLLGLVASSLLFALMHALNPNILANGGAGAALALGNIFLAGILLGGLFLLSGRLWLPTGVHLGWNWTTAVLFGLPVSGYRLPSLLETEVAEGSGLLSGGAFGPEGSIPGLAVIGLAAVLVAAWALKEGSLVPIVARHRLQTDDGAIIHASDPEPAESA